MDHRRVQRTLFRMQLDPGFASRLRAGEANAVRGLEAGELRLLRGADASAVSADRDGKRRAQFLANVSSEFPLSIAAGLEIDGFTTSRELHRAAEKDESLPLAFAEYAHRLARAGAKPLHTLVKFESAMSRARRLTGSPPVLRPCELAVAPWVLVGRWRGGSLALAEQVRALLDARAQLPALVLPRRAPEDFLIFVAPPTSTPFRLREVQVERVSPDLFRLLQFAVRGPYTRAELGKIHSTNRAELDPVIDELVADRVLVSG